MRLVDVYTEPQAATVLYALLRERPQENWISHKQMPGWMEHVAFVDSHPFLLWLLIEEGKYFIGAIEVTDRNEIGIAVFKVFQRRGYGKQALKMFMEEFRPLPAVPAIRNGHWLANISVFNEDSKMFFRKLGFGPIQETWQLYE